MMNPAMNQRLDYLDAVRAFALLLGIVFHASLSFLPIFIGWAVMDISTSPVVALFVQVSHSFRMELFFLIAGFFGHMTLKRKGAGDYVASRLTRIAIPFVAGWFLLRPLIYSGWVMGGESMRGEVDILNGLKMGFMSLSELPQGLFVGTHLWFLYYLLLITAIVLIIDPLLGGRTNRAIAWLVKSRFSLLLLSLPTSISLWFMSNWGMDTPDKSLIPHVPTLAVYCGFFLLGWLLHRQEGLIGQFSRITAGRIVLCGVSVGLNLWLSAFQLDAGHPYIEWIRSAYSLTYAVMMWSLAVLVIGLFKRYLDRPSRTVRYVADASYWLYLVHLPIVIWLQIAFAELPLHWSFKLAAISLLTIGLSLVLYDLVVRPTLIGKILNGRRKERVLFRRKSAESKLQPGVSFRGAVVKNVLDSESKQP